MIDLSLALSARSYPGRGLLVGRLATGAPFAAYFLTGRSVASRARRLEVRNGTDVAVVDTTGGPHDQLRHYVALTQRGPWLVAGNGDQVDPLAEALSSGTTVVEAWSQHTYEPDPPIFTPRIWLAWDQRKVDRPMLGYVRRSERTDGSPNRVVWSSDLIQAGSAVLLTTYCGTVTGVTTTEMPSDVSLSATTVDEALSATWEALDPSLRVAALAFDPRDLRSTLRLCE